MKSFPALLHSIAVASFLVAVSCFALLAVPSLLPVGALPRTVAFYVAAVGLTGIAPCLYFVYFAFRLHFQRRRRAFARARLDEVIEATLALQYVRRRSGENDEALPSALRAVMRHLDDARSSLDEVLPIALRHSYFEERALDHLFPRDDGAVEVPYRGKVLVGRARAVLTRAGAAVGVSVDSESTDTSKAGFLEGIFGFQVIRALIALRRVEALLEKQTFLAA